MGVVNSKIHLSENELKFKPICQNTYIGDLPVGCFAVKRLDLLERLKQQNYNFNVSDDHGKSPLHYAIDNQDAFLSLLETNISLYAIDLEGNTPLHYAVLCDNPFFIKPLLRSISVKNNAGYSPFHLAVKHSKYDNVCCIINNIYDSIFLKKTYLINDFLDANNMTPLTTAISNNDMKMLNLLKDFIDVEKAKLYLVEHGKSDYDSALQIMTLLS